jgi:hypothetical protein
MMSPISPKVTRSKSIGAKLNSKSSSLKKLAENSPTQPYTPSPPSKPEFATFGKKAGARLLTELRAKERMQNLRLMNVFLLPSRKVGKFLVQVVVCKGNKAVASSEE